MRRAVGRAWLVLFGADAVVHVVALARDVTGLVSPTQWMAAPVLAAALALLSRRPWPRLVWFTLLGLFWGWLGDLLPAFAGERSFLVMVGCFLIAQVAFAVPWAPRWRASLLVTPWVVLYVAAAGLLVSLCLPSAGPLVPAVIAYAVVLTLAAVLATGVNPLVGLGGGLFFVSDGLLALSTFVHDFAVPASPVLVMSSYFAALLLIVLGVLREARP